MRRVNEDRRVDEGRDRRDGRRGVADGHGPHDVVEVEGRHRFADPKDQLVVEQGLTIPELVQFLAGQGRATSSESKPGKAPASPLVGCPVNCEELGPERAALPAEELLGVEVQVDDREAVEAPIAGVPAAGEHAAGVADPEASEADPRSPCRDRESRPSAPVPGDNIDGRRVGTDRLRASALANRRPVAGDAASALEPGLMCRQRPPAVLSAGAAVPGWSVTSPRTSVFSAPRVGTASRDGEVRFNQRLKGRQFARRLRTEGRRGRNPDESGTLAMGGSAASASVTVGAGSSPLALPTTSAVATTVIQRGRISSPYCGGEYELAHSESIDLAAGRKTHLGSLIWHRDSLRNYRLR